MFYSWCFAILEDKWQNLSLAWSAGYSPSKSSFSETFLEFIMELVRSLSSDNNQVPFYLCRRETVLKLEKVHKVLSKIVNIFFIRNQLFITSEFLNFWVNKMIIFWLNLLDKQGPLMQVPRSFICSKLWERMEITTAY